MTDASQVSPEAAAAAQAQNAVAAAAAAASKPWHEGKMDVETTAWLQNKGLALDDPAKLALGLIPQYRGVEKLVGVKPEELVRWPKDVGDSDNWNNVYTRLGVPKEPKDYDLSTVKRADGTDIDQTLADTIRASLHKQHVGKEAAPLIAKDFVKYIDDKTKSDLAEVTATVQKEKTALAQNWGTKFELNSVIAKQALEKVGAASGLTPDQIKIGWDAISNTGGIGASYAMQMLLTIGSRMGEAPFIAGSQTGSPELMSRESAGARIRELQADAQWSARFKAGGQNSKEYREWQTLHAVYAGQAA